MKRSAPLSWHSGSLIGSFQNHGANLVLMLRVNLVLILRRVVARQLLNNAGQLAPKAHLALACWCCATTQPVLTSNKISKPEKSSKNACSVDTSLPWNHGCGLGQDGQPLAR